MTPRPPLYQPSPLRPGASAVEIEQHEAAMKQYAQQRRERDRDVTIEMLTFVGTLVIMAVVGVAAVVFGEHVMWWFLGTVGALFFGGLCWMAALLVKDLLGERGE